MIKKETNFDALDDLNKEFNTMTDTEQIHFKNPVLNGLFYSESEKKKKIIETWGIPKRSVIQFVAESGVGKSTLVLLMCKELLEQGYNIAYIDTEKGINTNILRSMGIEDYVQNKNTKKGGYFVTYNETDCDKINTLVQKLAETNIFQYIVVDSLGAMESGLYRLGGTGSVDNQKVGGDSKAVKAVLKTINTVSASTCITFILINHLMQTIGTYIPREQIIGGRATEYLTDVIIELKTKGALYRNDKNDKIPIGQKVQYEIRKSRYGRGKCPIDFYIMYGQGIAMIPTLREVVEQIKVPYKGNRVPLVEMRGAGNGSMYIKDKEIKFRGELQLLNLIGQYYKDIISFVSPKDFSAKLPNAKGSNTWYEKELELIKNDEIIDMDIETDKMLKDSGVFVDETVDLTGETIDDE